MNERPFGVTLIAYLGIAISTLAILFMIYSFAITTEAAIRLYAFIAILPLLLTFLVYRSLLNMNKWAAYFLIFCGLYSAFYFLINVLTSYSHGGTTDTGTIVVGLLVALYLLRIRRQFN